MKNIQLIPDMNFRRGITILSQKDHKNGDRVTPLGNHSFYNDENAEGPKWKLAQWDSGPCLYENMIPSSDGAVTDGKYRAFNYIPKENMLDFHLDTSLYYRGRPVIQGDYWPHLLIEQGSFGYRAMPDEKKEYYKCGAEKIICSFDIRLTGYSHTPVENDFVRAAQFLMYFYVTGIDTRDFCWFGLQLFDSRWAKSPNYVGYDGGKADASGAMIYSIGMEHVYGGTDGLWKDGSPNPSPDGQWIHVETDIKPYLEDMLMLGKKDGYFKADSLDGLCIDGMNLGWETIASFDHSMQMKNLALTSYIN